MKRLAAALLFGASLSLPVGLAACRPAQSPDAMPAGSRSDLGTVRKIRAALAGPARTDAERGRDGYRHPLETLAFFGLKDDMHVVELWPGGGWYTAILGPVLRERGKLTVTAFDPNTPPEWQMRDAHRYLERLASHPDAFDGVEVATINPPETVYTGGDASADMVLTFRNFHGFIDAKIDDKIAAEAFRVLKPGGVFGVVEHRAKPGADAKTAGKTGYVPEEYVIAVCTKAGFRLDARSEVNANPDDTKDYPEGVWALPPALDVKGASRKDTMRSIGESDRMTLRFVKPS